MKKIFSLCIMHIICLGLVAQAPQLMSYQAVIRDNSNTLLSSQTVGMQISILQGNATGTAVYVETHSPTTNTNGLISIQIGAGSAVSGTIGGIDWTNGPYYLKTETDPAGGTNYTISGASQMISTPYALYANNAQTAESATTINKTNLQPFTAIYYIIATDATGHTFPSRNGSAVTTSFLAEIRLFAGNFAPAGWSFCEGQLLPINTNQSLFSILGTAYGGDGRTTFGLPDLRGRVPIGPGSGPGLSTYSQGQTGGIEDH